MAAVDGGSAAASRTGHVSFIIDHIGEPGSKIANVGGNAAALPSPDDLRLEDLSQTNASVRT